MPQPKQQTKATIIKAEWSNLTVEYGRMEEAGEYDFTMPKNAISVAFAPHERVTWSVDGEAPRTTSLPAGSVFLYSEREFVWHRREKASEYVNLMLEPQLINQLADDNGITTSIDLEHKVIFSDPTILHVAQLLKSEAINGGLSGNLYSDYQVRGDILNLSQIEAGSYIVMFELNNQIYTSNIQIDKE